MIPGQQVNKILQELEYDKILLNKRKREEQAEVPRI